jgi:cation:H+ antiporter
MARGATLVALATSLHEVSTTVDALRLGAHSMAMANLLGTNALVPVLFVCDLAYAGATSGGGWSGATAPCGGSASTPRFVPATYLGGLVVLYLVS